MIYRTLNINKASYLKACGLTVRLEEQEQRPGLYRFCFVARPDRLNFALNAYSNNVPMGIRSFCVARNYLKRLCAEGRRSKEIAVEVEAVIKPLAKLVAERFVESALVSDPFDD